MPRITNLIGFHMAVVQGKDTIVQEGNGGPETVDMWTLILTDRQTHDQIRIGFHKDSRDELVRQLTGGIVLAGGEFPKV